MNITSGKLKLIIAAVYLSLLFIGLYFLFSAIDLKDLTSYNFIKSNKDIILEYKEENFLFLTIAFFIFCIIWVLFLGLQAHYFCLEDLFLVSGGVFRQFLFPQVSEQHYYIFQLVLFLRNLQKKNQLQNFLSLESFLIKTILFILCVFVLLEGEAHLLVYKTFYQFYLICQ